MSVFSPTHFPPFEKSQGELSAIDKIILFYSIKIQNHFKMLSTAKITLFKIVRFHDSQSYCLLLKENGTAIKRKSFIFKVIAKKIRISLNDFFITELALNATNF